MERSPLGLIIEGKHELAYVRTALQEVMGIRLEDLGIFVITARRSDGTSILDGAEQYRVPVEHEELILNSFRYYANDRTGLRKLSHGRSAAREYLLDFEKKEIRRTT